MKNFTALLSKGNLTPKERVLLWVANKVSEDRDGKKILTEADEQALVRNWRPQDNAEAREYNRFNDGWTAVIYARLDAQTLYLNAEISLLQASRLVDYAVFMNEEQCIEKCAKFFSGLEVDEDAALELVLENSGLAYEDVVYGYAFEKLGKVTRQDILTLYPDAETERHYLDQQETIANLLKGKETLTQEAKEKLAGMIVAALVNRYAPYMRSKGLSCDDWWFESYYADIPPLEVLKKWAEYRGIAYEADDTELEKVSKAQPDATTIDQLIEGDPNPDPELRKDQLRKQLLILKLKEYARQHQADIGEMLRETTLKWLNDGLLSDEYAPLCISKEKNTCNDADTKLIHKEVFKKWMIAKIEVKAELQKLIDAGELKIQERVKKFLGVEDQITLITGESLYGYQGDFVFVRDFKNQVDDLKPFGTLILYLREQDFLKHYATLLGFKDIFEQLSKTYEIDLAYKVCDFISTLQEGVRQLNKELRVVAEKLEAASYQKHEIACASQFFIDDMLIKLKGVKVGNGEAERYYRDELKKILGDDF